ncbi:MAG: TIGR01212 family radical SAM protein [Cyanobacteria bacterium HKST-UBA04]|nr:TIGR01212 family radical SAM protein [Cyanobacteria bacterium HKST-UBA04]
MATSPPKSKPKQPENKPLSGQEKPYLPYSQVLREKFGCKVYKVTLDAGFTCPNRDGSKGVGGCTFCDTTGSSSRAQNRRDSLTEQIQKNIDRMRARFGADKFVPYFQSFTNTYAPPDRLKRLYDEALSAHDDVIGLAISTRPDCVDEAKLDLIATYKRPDGYLCVEYGMQTIHDKSLALVNRCETYADFRHAFELTRARGIDQCVHVILGMPGETHADMMATARALSDLKPEGVKIHCLCAMEHTPLARLYERGQWQPLAQADYVALVTDFLEHLDPAIAIHRITGNGHRKALVAPRWLTKKFEVLEQVEATFAARQTRQGSALQDSPRKAPPHD